jgi:predicted aminopeptidase
VTRKNKNIIQIFWQTTLLLLVTYIGCNSSMWVYLLQQGKGQLTIIFNTQPIEKALHSNDINEEQKQKILLIQEIKTYAEENFSFTRTNNYSSFYDQKGKPILWMLTACEPYSFDEKQWRFPMIGEVSYKGYFSYKLAQDEALQLKMQHYDVDVGKVSAWSTLGILSDPILSSMLNNNVGELAELIIHELTHATVYLASNVDFNENLASFVGQKGAIEFIKYKYGENSKEMATYAQEKKDEEALKSFILKKKTELETFYRQLKQGISEKDKLAHKKSKIDDIINELYLLDIYDWKIKVRIANKIRVSGNAFFMSYKRYNAQYQEIDASFKKCNGNLKLFIDYVKENKQLR